VGTITGLDYWTTGLDYWTTGLDYWTGLLDTTRLDYWTTGLDYWTHPNCKIQLIQCRTEAKLSYFLSYFANTALSWSGVQTFLEFLEDKGHVHI